MIHDFIFEGKDYLFRCEYFAELERKKLLIDGTGLTIKWSRSFMYNVIDFFSFKEDLLGEVDENDLMVLNGNTIISSNSTTTTSIAHTH